MDGMFSLVAEDSFYERPIPPRHRIVFYAGHVEAFDRNLVGVPSFAPELDALFAFGIDPPPGELPADGPDAWPALERVLEYRDRVRELVDTIWPEVSQQKRHVAIEHRLMHAETFAYMLHGMDPARLVRPGNQSSDDGLVTANEMFSLPSGEACLGQPDPDEFGWDNEFPSLRVFVPAFRIDRYPVTNADWLQFVESGGSPSHFWRCSSSGWRLRTLFEEIALPLSWPVYVTHEQASAYAAWRGSALPAEQQWQRAAYGDRPCRYPWGNSAPDAAHGNFGSRRFDPEPVTAHADGASPEGVEDLLGNGWEWTSTPFRPFPGFEPFPFYANYSAGFFDNQHYVLKGGSPRTDRKLVRRSFRNWFRRDYQYVYAKFRCVQNSH
jgi:formylglycine-generating enzyme required for sulfatase activity